MKRFCIKFLKSESGAISADWVAITAAGMLLAVAIAGSVKTSTINAGAEIGANVTAMATP